jgi:predicted nucleotidyltransferase
LPEGSASLLQKWQKSGAVADDDYLLRLVLARIHQGGDSLKAIYQIGDGLENRLVEMAERAASLDELVGAVKSRQLTRTRIQRALCYLLNEVHSEQMEGFLESGPLYLHLLGCSRNGERFLARYRKGFALPVLGNYSRIYPRLQRRYGAGTAPHRLAVQMLELELRATRNYTLLLKRQAWDHRNRDFFEALRRVE